jgi:hypothetical protein
MCVGSRWRWKAMVVSFPQSVLFFLEQPTFHNELVDPNQKKKQTTQLSRFYSLGDSLEIPP